MWNDNESEGCIYDTVDCTYCNGCGKLYKEQCNSFGNLDGMDGSCHYCKEDTPDLFQACWNEKFKDVKPKMKR